MKPIALIVFLMMLTSVCRAEEELSVFKCKLANGEIAYQSEPCAKSAKQSIVDVPEMSPEEAAQAKENLRLWQDQQAQKDAEKAAVEQERQEALRQIQTQEAQRRLQAQQMQPPPPPTGINRRFGYLPY